MRRHIAVVTTSYPSQGDDVSGHFVRSEVLALVGLGHRVTVLCPGEPEAEPRFGDDLRVLRLGASRLFGWPGAVPRVRTKPWLLAQLPGFVRRARRALRQLDCDEVIAHWLLCSGFPIATTRRLPTEVVVHGSDARLLQRLGAAPRRFVLNQLERHGCRLRLVAPHLAPLLLTETNAAWVAAARVQPLPLSVPPLPDRTELRKRLGIADSDFAITIAARLVPSKRVEAALRYVSRTTDARITVVGSGPLLEPLRQQFPQVRFTGQLPRAEALAWLKASDVVLSASVEEGAPTALREARELGVPVWTAEYGSAREWSLRDPGVRVVDELSFNPSEQPRSL